MLEDININLQGEIDSMYQGLKIKIWVVNLNLCGILDSIAVFPVP